MSDPYKHFYDQFITKIEKGNDMSQPTLLEIAIEEAIALGEKSS